MTANNDKTNFIKRASSSFTSLIKQTSVVALGLPLLLLITGGNSFEWLVPVYFCLGIIYVTWAEVKRLNNTTINSKNKTQQVSPQAENLIKNKLISAVSSIINSIFQLINSFDLSSSSKSKSTNNDIGIKITPQTGLVMSAPVIPIFILIYLVNRGLAMSIPIISIFILIYLARKL